MPFILDGILRGGEVDVSILKQRQEGIVDLPEELDVPASGNKTFRIYLRIQDSEGAKDADSTATVKTRIEDGSGDATNSADGETDYTNTGVVKVAGETGLYYREWTIPAAAVLEVKRHIWKWDRTIEASVKTFYAIAETVLVEEAADLNDIQTDLGSIADAASEAGAAHPRLRAILEDVDKLQDSALTNTEPANTAYYKAANGWESEPVTTLNDATVGSGATENALDKGLDTGTPRFRLDAAYFNVTSLGSNTQITFELLVEINGTLASLGTEVRTATGVFDFLSKLGILVCPVSRHVRVTYVGNNAANNGTVTGTLATSKGGI